MELLRSINTHSMTIGRKFARQRKDRTLVRILDHRTRSVLTAISNEPKGKALGAYLRAVLSERSG